MEMIEKSEEISGCILENFKRDGPSFGLHRILEEDCYSNWREQQLPQQRRLHPTKMEDDKNEVIKWLGVAITFPLNIFMPSRILAKWRVFMDYKGTRKKYTSMVAQKGAMLDCWNIPTLMALDEDVPAKPPDGGTRTIVAARLTSKGVLAERTSKQLDEVYMPWQCCPQQEPSNSMDVELARLDVLLREATYDINNMLQQSTHWDTEILMQEVKEKWKESSPMCGTQLEPLKQEHVDEKECPNELQQRIATANTVEPEQSNSTTTLSEAEKSNASANSKESDANNDITTLMIKHESVNCSYPQLTLQLHDNMIDYQDDACLGDDTLYMVIPSDSSVARKSLLMEMIEKSEEISGSMLENFKRDGPSFGLHRILEEDCYSNWREQQLPQQRRLHPTKMEDDKNEVIKWLGVDITFPLNIFMPSRILAKWRVFMDYKRTRKKYTSMVAQKGAMVSALAQLFFGNIVTRWRVRMDYKKYRKKRQGYLTPLNFSFLYAYFYFICDVSILIKLDCLNIPTLMALDEDVPAKPPDGGT
ncbi:hypothetical protein GQ457_01G016540 [Hibiscus cannabinus]